MRYSTAEVIEALANLRIRPGQKFFPRPDEVAEEIVLTREKKASEAQRKRQHAADEERERFFWKEVLPLRMATTGETEEQVLARYPSIKRKERKSCEGEHSQKPTDPNSPLAAAA